MARNLIVHILGDASQLTRSFNQSTTAANRFGAQVSGSMGKAEASFTKLQNVAAGAFIGAAAVSAGIAGIKRTTQAASDLAEQMSKNQQVFGASADSVLAFSETTARSLGVSQTAALEATGTFGNLFSAVGIIGPQAADISKQFVKLAADMASFNNASPEDVLLALRSGLTGEVEPLRRYGVLLSEARVQQEAMAKTGKTNVKELTNQDKALARIAIIMRDTTKAQGDFLRTSGGLANQQRILKAEVADLEASIGQLLLPTVLTLTSGLGDATEAALTLADGLRDLGNVEVPPIVVTIVRKFTGDEGDGDGFSLGDLAGPAKDAALKGFETQLPGLGFINELVKLLQKPPPPADIAGLSRAFDENFNAFTNAAVQAGQAAAAKAGPKAVAAFGEAGFKPLDVNEVGESLRRAFQAALEALDLRFDKAVFAENTAGALAILAEIEKAIRKRMETEGRTTELLRLLFQVEQDRAAVIAGQKATNKAAADKVAQDRLDAANALIDALERGVTKAELTKPLKDDLAALQALKTGIEQQIKAGVDVVANQDRLLNVTGRITSKQGEIDEAARTALETQQFRKLGVGPGGEAFTPAIKNLRKQFAQLSQNPELKDAPKKLQDQMKLVGKALMDPNLTPAVRKWINDLFGTIRGTFDQESNKGLATPRRVQISDKILQALGFDQDVDARKIQKFTQARGAAAPRVTTAVGAPAAGAGGVVISGNITVVADNPDAFLRELQKKAARQTATSRGRFPGRSMGLG